MTYLQALQDGRTQYAIATGKIDDTCEREVVQFLEGIMRKAAKKEIVPENGYMIIDNGYGYFTRKIENSIEASKESDLETVLEQIDKGMLKKYSVDKKRYATYYIPELSSLKEMETLLEATGDRLNDAILEYEGRLRKHQETFSMKESVSHLTGRVSAQTAAIAYIRKHQ